MTAEEFWALKGGDQAERTIRVWIQKNPELRTYLRRALEALYVANAAHKAKPGTGCLLSSVTFTHGASYIHNLKVPFDTTDNSWINILADYISQNSQENVNSYPAANLTPIELREFLKDHPRCWVITGSRPNLSHMVGIVSLLDFHYLLCDFNSGCFSALNKKFSTSWLEILDINELHARLKIHHADRIENPLTLVGFKPKQTQLPVHTHKLK